jgi:hypothetical protein
VTYREQWRVPTLWWLLGLALSLGAAAELHGGGQGLRAVLPYVVLLPVMLGFLIALSRGRVTVQDGQLHVPGARAPLTAFGEPLVLEREQLRQWRGPRAQRDAWVRVRPWFRQAVLLPVTDPGDDTPYWLIGSRRADQLALACMPPEAARDRNTA